MTRFDKDATALMVRYLAKRMLGIEFEHVRQPGDKPWRELEHGGIHMVRTSRRLVESKSRYRTL